MKKKFVIFLLALIMPFAFVSATDDLLEQMMLYLKMFLMMRLLKKLIMELNLVQTLMLVQLIM